MITVRGSVTWLRSPTQPMSDAGKLAQSAVNAILLAMSRMPSNRSGENFIEFALIIILLAIVMLSILLIVGGVILLGFGISRSKRPLPTVSELPAQPSPSETATAPGTAVFTVPEESSKPTGNYIERSPITLVDNTTASTSDAAQPPATSQPDEVPDIYDFLKSAPPDPGN